MKKDTGGPAFPGEWSKVHHTPGMTLRDYFAAKAMQSFIRTAANGVAFGAGHPETNLQYAIAAYAMADAMLKAREE